MKPSDVTYITGNAKKAEYFAKYIGFEIAHQKVELDEIQSVNLDEIVEHKVRQAYDIIKKPVLVEDVALGFRALNGLPGPFIKFFVEYTGVEPLCRMLDGFDDRSALGECMYGYCDGKEVVLFRGGVAGTIADSPRGEGGFGWDRIFIPEGYTQTRAELSPQDYEIVYKKIKPVTEVAKFLKTRFS